jgi:GlpG protein
LANTLPPSELRSSPDSPSKPVRRLADPWLTQLAGLICAVLFVAATLDSGSAVPWGYVSAHEIWNGAYWGLLTNVFVHSGIVHFALNMYWLWLLGGRMESVIGSARFLGFFVTAALYSSLCELAVFGQSGVGLSGIVYAIFGYMWLLRKQVPVYRKSLTRTTVWILALWLIACVPITYVGGVPIANVAHFSGLIFGVAIAAGRGLGIQPRLVLSAVVGTALLAAAALFYCPWSIEWLVNQAYRAHAAERYEAALQYYDEIIARDPQHAWAFFNRSRVYQALGEVEKAERDYAIAVRLDPQLANEH